VQSGLLNDYGHGQRFKLGKIHTQIVIDAEQTLEDNIIKVNKIQKKFIGYDSQEVSEFVRMKKFT
jgi:hypothetical protein